MARKGGEAMHKRLLSWLLFCLLALSASPSFAEETQASLYRALLVGCDDFVSHEDTAPSARMNVRRMREILLSDARGYERIVSHDQGMQSSAQLLSIIAQTFAQADENDVSLLYICTHGLFDRITFEPALVLSDGDTEDVLTAPMLRSALDAVSGQKVIILDACNSGAFIGKGEWSDRMQNWFEGEEYNVLTSAGANENSFLWHASNQTMGGSYFAAELSEGLRTRAFDMNGDGIITLSEAYLGILEDHGASMSQCYPQESDYPLYIYDPSTQSTGERPIGSIELDTHVLKQGEDTLYFSFTVHRPVRVQYQLIYYKDGVWRFDAPQIVKDSETDTGVLLPGRKERSVTLMAEDEENYGYVLLQIIATEGRHSMLAGSRLIAVQPDTGDPRLRVRYFDSFSPAASQELAIRVAHAFPCSLSVVVRDQAGNTVRRLAYKEPSRPLGMLVEGSVYYWDGRNNMGEMAPPGSYVVEVTCKMGDTTYSVTGASVELQ